MGKGLIIGIVIVLLIVAGVAVMMMKGGDKSDTGTSGGSLGGTTNEPALETGPLAEIGADANDAAAAASSANSVDDISSGWEEEAPSLD